MKRKPFSLARAAMKLLCTVLGLVFLVMLGATLYCHDLMDNIHYVPRGSAATLSAENTAIGSDASLAPIGGKGSHIINILLIGQDHREGEAGNRSDTIILCTYNKNTNQLTLTSFLRDLYVPIPGHGKNRLNAAYSAGGMDLLTQTLEQNFGLYIDGTVEVDFDQFCRIVDLMGGVELELRQDETDHINMETGSALSPGLQRLNGQQALSYARIRKLDMDGDFSRTNRQRNVIRALLAQYRNAKPMELIPILDDILAMITTNMSNGEILSLAVTLVPKLSEVTLVSQHVPAAGTYTDQTINGMAVLVPDRAAVRRMLTDTLL